MSSQTLTVLFADLAGSTRLYQTEGDVEAHQQISDSLQRMRTLVEQHDGELLRTVGDAVLASFHSTDSAYFASVAIQKAHRSLNLAVRVGFHHGEVIPDAGDVYGNAVNLAARVAAFAEANEICTTEESVAQMSNLNRSTAIFLDRVEFKGISAPMPVYRIQWDDDNQETAIVSPTSDTVRYQDNLVLDLIVDARRFSVDSENPVITFGRAFNNDVMIDIDCASRNHARIVFIRGRFMIHDASTNGTYVLRSGLPPTFIRRESTTLDHFGSIGLGFSPDGQSRNVVEFRVTRTTTRF